MYVLIRVQDERNLFECTGKNSRKATVHKDTPLNMLNRNNIAKKPTLMLQKTKVQTNVSKFSIYKIIEVALIVVLWFLSHEIMELIN